MVRQDDLCAVANLPACVSSCVVANPPLNCFDICMGGGDFAPACFDMIESLLPFDAVLSSCKANKEEAALVVANVEEFIRQMSTVREDRGLVLWADTIVRRGSFRWP
jgi:hypothetical protein